jgi:hypothetical protein
MRSFIVWKALSLMHLPGLASLLALFLFLAANTTLVQLITDHQISATFLLMYTFSAAVSAMRNPPDGFYNWFYRFVGTMANVPATEFGKLEKLDR